MTKRKFCWVDNDNDNVHIIGLSKYFFKGWYMCKLSNIKVLNLVKNIKTAYITNIDKKTSNIIIDILNGDDEFVFRHYNEKWYHYKNISTVELENTKPVIDYLYKLMTLERGNSRVELRILSDV